MLSRHHRTTRTPSTLKKSIPLSVFLSASATLSLKILSLCSIVLTLVTLTLVTLALSGCGLFLEGAFVEKSTTEEAQPFGSMDNVTIQGSSPDGGLKSGIGPKTFELSDFSKAPSEHVAQVVLLSLSGDVVLSIDSVGTVLARRVNEAPRSVLSIPGGFEHVAVSPNLAFLAAWRPNKVTLYSLPSGKVVSEFSRLSVRIKSLAFDPFEKSLLIGGADSRIYRWNFTLDLDSLSVKESEKEIERYIGPSSVVSSLWYHPTGQVFLSGDWFGKLFAWKPYDADKFKGKYDTNIFGSRFFAEGEVVRVVARNISKETFAIDFIKSSLDASIILLGIQSGALEIWDLRGASQRYVAGVHKGPLYDIAVSPKGGVIASVGHDGLLSVNQIVKTRSSVAQSDEYSLSNILSENDSLCRSLLFTDEETLLCGTNEGKIESRTIRAVS